MLESAGIPVPAEVQGESLLTLVKPASTAGHAGKTASKPADSSPERSAYAESDYPHRTFGWSTLRSLRTGKYLFVQAPREELYDQPADPKEEHNLATASPAVTHTLAGQLDAFREKTSTSKEAPKVVPDPGLQERLNALGYVATDSSSSSMPGIKDTGADPKDKVQVVNLLHRAEMAKEDTRFAEAVPLLEQVIALEPNLPITYLQLGTALTSLKEYEKAVPVLRKAVEMRPDLTNPRFQLGSALFETGDLPGAIAQLEIAVSRSPQWPEALFLLATAYARADRLPDAVIAYQKVTELRPKHYAAHLLLGRALALSGSPEQALAPLNKAAELQPASPEPHAFLADAFTQLGRTADAENERSEAQRLRAGTKR
jgi:tetratricopeptide (TPR) repeat protein